MRGPLAFCSVVRKLLPEHVDGLDIEHLVIPAGNTLTGVPHTMGTREYLSVINGVIDLRVAGDCHRLAVGDATRFLAR